MADALFSLRVLSPLGTVFEGKARSATLPTAEGEIMVLAHHMPLVSRAGRTGRCASTPGGDMRYGLPVRPHRGRRLSSDTAPAASAAPEGADRGAPTGHRALRFRRRSPTASRSPAWRRPRRGAEELLAEKKDRGELLLVERDLQRAILQLKIAEKVRKRRP